MKTTRLSAALAAGLGVLMAGAGWAETLRIGVVTPPQQAWTLETIRFAEGLTEATEGRIETEIFHSGQLGTEADMLRQVQSGTLDMMLITVSELANRVAEMNLLLAPGLVASNEQAGRFLTEGETPRVLMALLDSRVGVHGLGYGMAGVTQVMTSFDAQSPADLRGRRVRITASPAILAFNQLIGSAPTPLPLPAIYDAFANGQVDALETNLDIFRVLNIADHARTLLMSNQGMFPAVVIVSARTWQRLSDEDRTLLDEHGAAYARGVIEATLAAEEVSRAHFQRLAAEGALTIVEVAPSDYADLQAAWDESFGQGVGDIAALRAEAARFAD